MLRHVIAPSSGWTKAPHTVVRDRRMNSDAKVLLLYVQGLPDSATDRPLGELARKLEIKGRAYQLAKKQLMEHGYVHEWRSQAEGGRWATDQLFTNTPMASDEARILRATLEPDGRRSPGVGAAAAAALPPGERYPTVGGPAHRTVGGYQPEEDHSDKTTPRPPSEAERQGARPTEPDPRRKPGLSRVAKPEQAPEQEPELPPEPNPKPEPRPAAPEPAPTPHPGSRLATAERLLLSLRHTHRDLLLGVGEARGLAVEVVKWLEAGLSEGDVRHALLSARPEEGVRSAVGFLRHRLIRKCPVAPPAAPPPPPSVRELIACAGEGEEHVFRPLGDETLCADCRRAAAYASWMVDTNTYDFPADMTWRQRVEAVRRADALRAAHSPQDDAGGDGQMVAAGRGQGADVADGGGTGHDLIDPGQRESGGEAEGEAPLGHVQA
ncbi:hypothetical protein YW3DRAFT_04517 [Streptomyces sp. MnatMP-M77]|nr:hypothetical protein YW3DRAFT_04517 [Streptomyces sp. MnatMP-M77]